MLDFHNILWVIPGIIFIHLYNRRRPNQVIDLSGWQYLFFLVFIAVLTWLPAEWLIYHCLGKDSSLQTLWIILLSIALSCGLFLIIQNESIFKWFAIPVYDNFYKKCIEWENEKIILTLKNEKVYKGLLWKYPDSPKSRHESQTISIVPLKSGYRKIETKKVVWDTNYPIYESDSDLVDMEVIIPRTEIVTFGKFSNKTFEHFEHFEKQKSTSDQQ